MDIVIHMRARVFILEKYMWFIMGRVVTESVYDFFQLLSALHKDIRRGNEEQARAFVLFESL